MFAPVNNMMLLNLNLQNLMYRLNPDYRLMNLCIQPSLVKPQPFLLNLKPMDYKIPELVIPEKPQPQVVVEKKEPIVAQPRQRIVWDQECDNLLLELKVKYKNDWKKISTRIFSLKKIRRSPHFMKNRYNHLKGNSKKQGKKFSHQEDLKIVAGYSLYGRDWVKIASYMKGRDYISVKNRFYSGINKKNLYEALLEELKDTELEAFMSKEL